MLARIVGDSSHYRKEKLTFTFGTTKQGLETVKQVLVKEGLVMSGHASWDKVGHSRGRSHVRPFI